MTDKWIDSVSIGIEYVYYLSQMTIQVFWLHIDNRLLLIVVFDKYEIGILILKLTVVIDYRQTSDK
jgi:hypothetical protein